MSISHDSNSENLSKKQDERKSVKENEISTIGIWISGLVFMVLFVVNMLLLVVFWPNKTPDAMDNGEPVYVRHNWGMHLMDSSYIKKQEAIEKAPKAAYPPVVVLVDSLKYMTENTLENMGTVEQSKSKQHECRKHSKKQQRTIHFNTLLLVLVVLGGFLGNLIHIATSFTAFVGLRKFKRSWLMWYYMKPFIASALALVVYFIFRGGFLSGPNDIYSINPYAIVSMALLTGLFTDVVTDKLKKMLDVIFPGAKAREDSTDEPLIKGISTTEVLRGKPTTILIFGENVDKFKNVTITLNNKEFKPTIGEDDFRLSYTHATNDPVKEVLIEIMLDKKVIKTFILMVKEE